jgi:hypothetical protein
MPRSEQKAAMLSARKRISFLESIRKKYFPNQEKIWSVGYKKPSQTIQNYQQQLSQNLGKNKNLRIIF